MIQASICTIGDEILIGQVVDTNSSHIAQALESAGIKVGRMLSIGDDHKSITESIEGELRKNGIVIVTGGLGPTKDDITKKALAELSGASSYRTDETQLDIIHRILKSRGLDVLDINIAQASVPDTCEVIPNRLGTAPIMVFRFPKEKFGHKASLYSLPGVPYEAIGALEDVVEDILRNHNTAKIYHKTIMTFGVAESALSKILEEWEDSLPSEIHLAYLPHQLTGVRLRLSTYEAAPVTLESEVSKLKSILGDIIYSDQEDTLEAKVGRLLSESGKTMSTAESCTGGTISQMLTSVPGSSAYFLGGIVSYTNKVKTDVLGVPSEIIDKHSAVSSECVAAMAEGARKITGSDFSVATSGIAGPEGGSEETPVGTVWIGVSSSKVTETYKVQYNGDRKRNIERFSAHALNLIRKKIIAELNA